MKTQIVDACDIPRRQGKYEEIVKKTKSLGKGESLKISEVTSSEIASIRLNLKGSGMKCKTKVIKSNNGSCELYVLRGD
jgi:hypothetical protein